MVYDVIIAGAGVTGGMLARELSKYSLSVCLLEKGNDVALGASRANSGIVHGGFDPEPDTLKAKLNVAGVPLLYEAARQLNVPCRQNGSLVLAFGKDEEPAIHELYERGIANGVDGMRVLSGDEARAIEPQLSKEVTLALQIPSAGIVCPYELTVASIGNAMDNGVTLKCNFKVSGIERGDCFTVTAESGEQVQGRYFCNCAGAYADRIAELAGDKFYDIIPRAGEYMLLDKAEGGLVSHTIFQVPTANGKGILVSPTVDGNLLTGPTAAVVDEADDTRTTAENLQVVSTLALKSVPTVNFRAVITSFSGVRASTKGGDFIIEASKKVDGLVHVAAIDSPGLSSCVAIARYVVDILGGIGLELNEKADWNGLREDPHAFRKMNDEQKDAFIKTHPAYGKIVCRCETVSEGEIRDAIRRNPPATDVDGVKRRTRSGMGRCQGGFCLPYVMRLLSEENGVAMEEVTKCGGRSNQAIGKL
jgi:glycerol-3-phosphate dehydrogenase